MPLKQNLIKQWNGKVLKNILKTKVFLHCQWLWSKINHGSSWQHHTVEPFLVAFHYSLR